jgi:hypothetical protein
MQDEAGFKVRWSGSTWRHRILWELAWLGVEATCVALGLYLMLGQDKAEIGGLLLLGFVCLAFVVRWRHYAASRSPDKSGGPRP